MLIKQDIDKIYLYAKDPYEAKYKLLTNKLKSICLTDFGASKAFSEYSNNMDHIYKSIDECNPSKKHKILIIFDNMIVDIFNNKT